jgi:hypothetical protein
MKRRSPASPKIARSDDGPYTDPDLRRLLEASADGEVQTMPTLSPQREIGSPHPETFTEELSSFVVLIQRRTLDLTSKWWGEGEWEEDEEIRREAAVEEALNKRELEEELSYYTKKLSEMKDLGYGLPWLAKIY